MLDIELVWAHWCLLRLMQLAIWDLSTCENKETDPRCLTSMHEGYQEQEPAMSTTAHKVATQMGKTRGSGRRKWRGRSCTHEPGPLHGVLVESRTTEPGRRAVREQDFGGLKTSRSGLGRSRSGRAEQVAPSGMEHSPRWGRAEGPRWHRAGTARKTSRAGNVCVRVRA
jgi:hypothetical protein